MVLQVLYNDLEDDSAGDQAKQAVDPDDGDFGRFILERAVVVAVSNPEEEDQRAGDDTNVNANGEQESEVGIHRSAPFCFSSFDDFVLEFRLWMRWGLPT